MNNNIYADIASRTQGDIYVGVVGPVRTGKSTFISKFMHALVVPKIDNKNLKQRTLDELPQSADGTTIMTMQPKFVPEQSITVELDKDVQASMRLVDCVGYLVDGVNGTSENGKPRMVKTPWNDSPITFEQAAEIGTSKVIRDHATIGVVVTTDGSICDIPRENYEPAEDRVINELLALDKPFIVVVNTKNPDGESAVSTKNKLQAKYNIPVEVINVAEMTEDDIKALFEKVLYEFPLKRMDVILPRWTKALDGSASLISEVMTQLNNVAQNVKKMGDYKKFLATFEDYDKVAGVSLGCLKLGEGRGVINVDIDRKVLFEMISEECEEEILDDFALMKYLKQVAYTKKAYAKIESALQSVEETGYGVVLPRAEDLILEDPQIVKKGNASAVKLKASAPSLHIMRVDVETEITPELHAGNTADDLAQYLVTEFENNPQGIWNTNMFGKPLSALAGDGISAKLLNIPNEAQVKMRRTLTKIVNENRGGIICILL